MPLPWLPAVSATGVIRVEYPKAVVGLMVAGGRVVDAAPYVRRRGWIDRDARDVWRQLCREGHTPEWIPA